VGDADLPKRFQRRLNETRERWQEAAEAYRSGKLGFGEEAIERLRRRLQEEGFGFGEAFSEWARANAPVHSASGLPQHHAGSAPEKIRKHRPLLAVKKALFYFIGYSNALLATIIMWWLIPLWEPAIALPLLLLIFALHPIVAALVMIAIGSLQVWYGISREIYWHAIARGATWFLGAIAAVAGVFQWYALLVGGISGISLFVPGVVAPAWHNVLRPIVAVDLLLSLCHIWGPALGISPTVAVTAATLMLIAVLVGVGADWRFEMRFRRSLAILLVFAGATLLLWRPVVIPAAQLVTSMVRSTAQLAIQVVSDSPLGKWYRSGAVVTIQSDPPGAAVHFDGRLMGATPVTLEKVRPGEYRVVLSKPGYRDVSQVVVVKRRESLTLSFKLDPLATPRPMRPASRTVSPLAPPPPPLPEPPPPPPPPEPPPSPPNP
jgi:hypothetical protein